MMTIYGLTDEHGQIRYVGMTCDPAKRFRRHCMAPHKFTIDGMAILARVPGQREARQRERQWIAFIGRDNLHNGIGGGGGGRIGRRGSRLLRKVTSVKFTPEQKRFLKLTAKAQGHYMISQVVKQLVENAMTIGAHP